MILRRTPHWHGALLTFFVLALTVPMPMPVRADGATFVVTRTDDGPTNASCQPALPAGLGCTLRQAINASNAHDPGPGNQNTIQFASGVSGAITLVNDGFHGTLSIVKNVAISGPTAGPGVTVDGDHAVGVFAVVADVSVTMTALTIVNGLTTFGGGIFNNGTLALANVTLSGNAATESGGGLGGAIANNAGDATNGKLALTNVTIANNTALGGGGIYNNGGAVTMTNSTISGNSAHPNQGGGILTGPNIAAGLSDVTILTNSIVAGNTNTNSGNPPDDIAGAVTGASNNLIGAGGSGGLSNGASGNIVGVANPLLGPLGSYGNPNGTQTLPLLPGSPAINAGTASGAPVSDQRGIARVGAVDIGAFESQGFALAKTSGDNQTAGINAAFAPLVVAVTSGHGEPVQNGAVTFTAPTTGPSIQFAPLTAMIGADGTARVIPVANANVGPPYTVTASANGASTNAVFTLANGLALTGISPNSGVTDGGNTVTLTGFGFGTPTSTQIFIDGVALPAAAITSVTNTTITFLAPAHAAATVTITVHVASIPASGSVTYQYGTVSPLPPPRAPGASGVPVNPVPSARAGGSPASGPAPGPLPTPRP